MLNAAAMQLSQIAGNRMTLDAAHRLLCAVANWSSSIPDLVMCRLLSTLSDSEYDLFLGTPPIERITLDTPALRSAFREREDRVELALIESQRPSPDLPRFIEGLFDDTIYSPEAAPVLPDWEPMAGLRTIFSPAGRFVAPDGKRFDYVFPEMARDPAIRPIAVAALCNGGARFESRYGDRQEGRVNIGRR